MTTPTPALANRGDAVERNLEAQRQTIEACARVAERGWIPSYVTGDLSDPEKWEPGSPYDRGEVAACKRIAASIRALRPNAMLAAHPASDREARLCAVLRECADDLEAEVRDRWGYDERLKHKLDRDMVPVMKARALLAEIEGTTRP